MNGGVHHRLLIPASEVDASRLLQPWSYLVRDACCVLGLSPFADWFLQQADGAVWRLDLLEGSFEAVAPSVEAFWAALGTAAGEDDLLLAGTVMALERQGLVRRAGQCYTYAVHPRLGAPLDTRNVQLGDIAAWQLFCSQLHRQMDSLPPGALVTGLDCDAAGRITVLWRAEQ